MPLKIAAETAGTVPVENCSDSEKQLAIFEQVVPGWRDIPLEDFEEWMKDQGDEEQKLYDSDCAVHSIELFFKFAEHTFNKIDQLKVNAKINYENKNYTQAEKQYTELIYQTSWLLGSNIPANLEYSARLGDIYDRQGRVQDFIDIGLFSLGISNSINGKDSELSALISSRIGTAYYDIGDFDRSEKYLLSAYQPDSAKPFNGYLFSNVGLRLAKTYIAQNKHNEAEAIYNKIINFYKDNKDIYHNNYRIAINDLAMHYSDLDKLDEAAELLKYLVKLDNGQDDLQLKLVTLSNLATVYSKSGNIIGAIRLNQSILLEEEKLFGKNNKNTIVTRSKLAQNYGSFGRYNKAVEEYLKILSIEEELYGKGHIKTAHTISDLGVTYTDLGNIGLAIQFSKDALKLKKEYHPRHHTDVGISVNNLALAYASGGKLQEAIEMLEEQLEIYENAYGDSSSHVSTVLNNLAYIYSEQGQHNDAIKLYKRALSIEQGLYGEDSKNTIGLHSNIGLAYQNSFDYEKALEHYNKGLEISNNREAGEITPSHLILMNNVSLMSIELKRYNDALQNFLYVNRMEKALYGEKYVGSITTLHNIAYVYMELSDYDSSIKYQNKSINLLESIFGQNLPSRHIETLSQLSKIHMRGERYQDALEASYAMYSTFYSSIVGDDAHVKFPTPDNYNDTFVRRHVDLLLNNNIVISQQDKLEKSFEAVQFAVSSSLSIGKTISKIGMRLSSGDSDISKTLRQQQDIMVKLKELNSRFINLMSQPVAERDQNSANILPQDIENNQVILKEISDLIIQKYPRYAELSSMKPISLGDAQNLLSENEAMVIFSFSDDAKKTHVWSLTNSTASVTTVDVGYVELRDKIKQLRKGVELDHNGKIRDFDLTISHELFDLLLASTVDTLDGINHLIIVPEGPLLELPFNLLTTKESEPATLSNNKRTEVTRGISVIAPPLRSSISTLGTNDIYRNTSWLIDRFSLSTIPTIRSLKSLRKYAKPSEASEPFIGFGDPVLNDSHQLSKRPGEASLFSRGVIADVNEVRSLASLPDTAAELERIASYLKADISSVMLRERATERSVKTIDLVNKKVIAFATHGLLSGEFEGFDEPGLVLTPPDTGTVEDDGVLTASEIAKLTLDADWVILSACNTAAGNKPNAGGLSGLANAFFYAGTRTLLVSHWPVVSTTTTMLTSRIFDEINRNPTLIKSEALRRSMASMKNSEDYSHPIYWAPFSLIGLSHPQSIHVTP